MARNAAAARTARARATLPRPDQEKNLEYLIGVVVALAVSLSATLIGFDRDRAFYPTLIVVIAFYYGLFAVTVGSVSTLLMELAFIAAFFGLAVFGFKRNLWLIVVALIAHGVFDFFHGHLIDNPGVPVWWPAFCLSCDLVMAAYLAWLLKKSRLVANPEVVAAQQVLRNGHTLGEYSIGGRSIARVKRSRTPSAEA